MVKKTIININIVIIVLIFAIFSCQKNKIEKDLSSQLDYVKNITEFIQQGKYIRINLDKLKYKIIKPVSKITNNNLISKKQNKYFLSAPYSCILKNDSLIIVDSDLNCLFIADKNGKIINKYGRKGNGPGEFIKPSFIVSNKNFIAVYNNTGIVLLDDKFKFITKLDAHFAPFGSCMSMNSYYLFTLSSNPQKLSDIDIYNLTGKNFGEYYGSINMPMIIEYGKQPIAINKIVIDVIDDYIFSAYSGLPFLFVFDQANKHLLTIEIVGKIIDRQYSNVRINKSLKSNKIIVSIISSLTSFRNRLIIQLPKRNILELELSLNDELKITPKILYKLQYDREIVPSNIYFVENSVFACYNFDSQVVKYQLNK